MCGYQEHGIKLHEAMTKEMIQRVRIWETCTHHQYTSETHRNPLAEKSLVIKSFDNTYKLQITVKSDSGNSNIPLGQFSTLEELQTNFPHLFELNGDLYAFF